MRTFRFRVQGFSTNPRDLRWYDFEIEVRSNGEDAWAAAVSYVETLEMVPHALDLLEG